MTQLEHSFLYRADWAWQRTEEGLLALRYYWWCVQAAVLILVSLYRRYGLMVAINGASVSSRHQSMHGWETTRGEPVSAVELIWGLRDEAKWRERAAWQASFDGPPMPDPQPLTSLDDRGPYEGLSRVRAIGDVEEPCAIMDDVELDTLWEAFMDRTPA